MSNPYAAKVDGHTIHVAYGRRLCKDLDLLLEFAASRIGEQADSDEQQQAFARINAFHADIKEGIDR